METYKVLAHSEKPIVIEFLLDETGSMQSCKDGVIAGYNSFLSDQKTNPGECFFTLTKFYTGYSHTPFTDLDIQSVIPMTVTMFNPGGGTNLRDTIIDRVEHLKTRLEKWEIQPSVIFMVMTDGEDNASRCSEKFVSETLNRHDWSFVYLGATPNALEIAHKLGFKSGNIKKFETKDIEKTIHDLSAATTVFRATQGSSTNFF